MATEKQLGLICQGCGNTMFRVLRTLRYPGALRRRRECRSCRTRMTTEELIIGRNPADDPDGGTDSWSSFRDTVHKLSRLVNAEDLAREHRTTGAGG